MEPIIVDNLERITELCREYHVKRLYVFGSATGRGIDGNPFNESSDIDLLIEYEDIIYDFEHFDYIRNADAFHEQMQLLFGRKVDIVNDSSIRNRRFRQYIEKQKQLVYAA
ncbi:nucleotidyltransferase domain-containing protein [Parabacteroides sp. PF5-6]|uniref:nucleotidyltransferase family protein n=1 Tax=Parabacteroides sp. PF5-6 TaxID=1742403 RepID=UPI002404C491|nr:nucleotidyltransferase domain-containing protein [Parabacteroides sp. PF5-6]MDF9831522.1 putative nucleotidyltransferase [Parabacteroides sp. PF5-6]